VRVAILATNDFEQSEMTEPRQALMEAGAQTTLIAPESGTAKSLSTFFGVETGTAFGTVSFSDLNRMPGKVKKR
jgi:putative intracellular protease/amidase